MKKCLFLLIVFLPSATMWVQSHQPAPGQLPNQTMDRPPDQKTPDTKQEADSPKSDYDKLSSARIKGNPTGEHHKADGYRTDGPEKQLNGTWSVGDKIAAILGVIATLQFFALIKTYRVMKDTEVRQLRAYIFPEIISLKNIVGSHPPQVIAHFKNSGQTPAHNVECRAEFGWGSYPWTIDFPPIPQDRIISKAPLGPGITLSPASQSCPLLSEKEIFGLKAGSAALYFYGQISYDDVFNQPHTTNFRYFFTHNESPFPQITQMTADHNGNEAD